MNLITNRAFQVLVYSLSSMIALVVLMVSHTVSPDVGIPLLTSLIGYAIGVPVTTEKGPTT